MLKCLSLINGDCSIVRVRSNIDQQVQPSKSLGTKSSGVFQYKWSTLHINMRVKRVTTAMISRKEELREYRTRNLVFWGLFLGLIPSVLLIAIPLGKQLNSDRVAGAVLVGWLFATFAAAIWRLRWKCPRCNKSFYSKWWYNNAFTTKCVNCGYRPAA